MTICGILDCFCVNPNILEEAKKGSYTAKRIKFIA